MICLKITIILNNEMLIYSGRLLKIVFKNLVRCQRKIYFMVAIKAAVKKFEIVEQDSGEHAFILQITKW